jgi:hypothetical protein
LGEQVLHCPDGTSIAAWKQWNAVPIAKALKPKGFALQADRFAAIREWLDSSNADYAVVSAEHFSGVQPEHLQQALNEHLPDHAASAKVIAYVRPHPSRFIAAFIQRTKTGTLFDEIDVFFDRIRKMDTLNYTARFRRWEQQFGDRFILRPFIRSELKDKDAVADFFTTVLGETPFQITRDVQENISVSLGSLAGLRFLHRHLSKAGTEQTERIAIGTLIANFYLAEVQEKTGGEKPTLDRVTAEKLVETYRADASSLDAAFFGRPLMIEALEGSRDTTRQTPVDLTPRLYFSQPQRKSLIALSREIQAALQIAPRTWATNLKVRKGKSVSSQDAAVGEKAVEQLDGFLTEAARILRD